MKVTSSLICYTLHLESNLLNTLHNVALTAMLQQALLPSLSLNGHISLITFLSHCCYCYYCSLCASVCVAAIVSMCPQPQACELVHKPVVINAPPNCSVSSEAAAHRPLLPVLEFYIHMRC